MSINMDDNILLTSHEIVAELEISADTLRNWQRLGVIERLISRGEIGEVKQKLIGQGRLSSRANKLGKVGDKIAPKHWSEYESSLTDRVRNREGIYYTPDDIVRDMMATISSEKSLAEKRFLDPCCGSGNFLVEALKLGFLPQNIYGFDTDSKAVAIARERVPGAKIRRGDFLTLSRRSRTKFDYIYTNPPWGKHLDAKQRKEYTQFYGVPHKADTSAIFFVAAQRLLVKGGRIGFLVQDAVFNIGAFEWLRERMLALRIESLKDYGRPFKGLVTGAQSVVIENSDREEGDKCWCSFRGECYQREIVSFARIPKKVMNFWATTQDMECMDAIYCRPHKTLEGAAKWGLGIVTGNNKTMCHQEYSPQTPIGVLRGSDIKEGSVEEPSIYISGEIERFQQSAPREIYEAEVKLIYKFISSRLVFYADHNQRYPLNSANCVVVDRGFGATHEQIAQLLNSEVMNWLFSMIYRSHKILRGDIETLPLHINYFEEYDHFCEESYCKYLGIERKERGGYRKICFYQQQ